MNEIVDDILECSICKETFYKSEGKFLIENNEIICPYCLNDRNNNDKLLQE